MAKNTILWQRTPPAIFPPVLGLLGLGLAWRRASEVFPIPPGVGEFVLGMVSLLFLFTALAYASKILRRPAALVDDLRIFSGRAGMSTAPMAMMLFAAVLVPYWPFVANFVFLAALVAHGVVAVLILGVLFKAPLPQRRMTPVWHLTFVGFIVAPIAGIPLGWVATSQIIFVLTVAAALAIWAGSVVLLLKNPVPAPLRPPLAIHLSPLVLFGIAAALLGAPELARVLGGLAIAGLGLLVARVLYLTAAGFSPFWGAFTFPLAAFVNLMLMLAAPGGGLFWVLGGLGLIAASYVIPFIAFKILRMWADASLAVKTNASQA